MHDRGGTARHLPEEDVDQDDDVEYEVNDGKRTICRTNRHNVQVSVVNQTRSRQETTNVRAESPVSTT